MKNNGKVFVISGPSGVGKTTVIRNLAPQIPDAYVSISVTTRPMRPGEQDGIDYHFVDRHRFDTLQAEDRFLEWTQYGDAFYGTPAEPVRQALAAGHSVLCNVDVQGGRKLKAAIPEAILIFLMPPGMQELEKRLRSRGDTPEEQIRSRLAMADQECQEALKFYDHLLISSAGVGRITEEILQIAGISARQAL